MKKLFLLLSLLIALPVVSEAATPAHGKHKVAASKQAPTSKKARKPRPAKKSRGGKMTKAPHSQSTTPSHSTAKGGNLTH